jgi:V-type H+-transporting ATPase subunit E
MEPEVNIRCRKSDIQLVERVIDTAAAEYKKLMKENVKAYANKEVVLKIILDEGKYLPEFKEGSESITESCMGGIILHAKRGRIVCSNTLDERLQLVYAEAIPEIRENLFPCLKKKEKPQAPVEVKHGHAKH